MERRIEGLIREYRCRAFLMVLAQVAADSGTASCRRIRFSRSSEDIHSPPLLITSMFREKGDTPSY